MSSHVRYGSRLVGDRFDLVPRQSAFGCLVRLARLNHLRHRDLNATFGLRLRRADSLPQVLARSRHQLKLAASLGCEPDDAWRPATWHPFQGGPAGIGIDALRYCLACIRTGYHCHLHQLPWFDRCPWHGVRLRSGCPRCGGSIADAGSAERPFLTCSCGFDLLDERSAARLAAAPPGAADIIDRYLTWAHQARDRHVLIGAAGVPFTFAVAAALVRVPRQFAAACNTQDFTSRAVHVRTYRTNSELPLADGAEDERRLAVLSSDCPQLLELPNYLTDSVRAVARETARKLPAGSLTEREQLLFLGYPGADLAGFRRADRPSFGTVRCLPPMEVGPRRFLELNSVHPAVLRTIAAVALSPLDRSVPHAALPLTRRIQRDLLCRGYAEGLRAILSRYIPELHDLPRDRPHLTAGWALIGTSAPFCARVAFTLIDGRAAPADLLSSARRQRR